MSAHDEYFASWQAVLQRDGVATPSLLVDGDRLEANARAVRAGWPGSMALRLGVKSLPCPEILRRLARVFETHRYMVFHPGHVLPVLEVDPQADILFGKPMLTAGVDGLIRRLAPEQLERVVFLADDGARLGALRALAERRGVRLTVALEVDIGLHRGGFTTPADIKAATSFFNGALRCGGLMGYDGHVGRIPWPLLRERAAHRAAMSLFRACRDALGSLAGNGVRLNAGGSLSYPLYRPDDGPTELTVGSAFVKPSHFDRPALEELSPAFFIAAPVLKRVERFVPPAVEWMRPAVAWKRGVRGAGVFLFGGRFDGRPVSPADLVPNDFLSDSANQALYQLDRGSRLDVGDWVFFRPFESEAQLDRFPAVLVKDGERLERFPTLQVDGA